ncbi:hypothetical protein [Duncaniella freteri]|jgi:hypothetical protein|uniref:hypothetical protein n=1 Tax=Duncaniella freteri TaxID=2530391 RepID=UPI00136DCFA4|nr:hypothetical protein [Duncaniella freteri]MDE7027585.1 hypothetical protein [Duncaniella freteri]
MNILPTIGLAIAMIALAVILLGIKIFFVKGGRFPSVHAHNNAELRRRGVGCHHDM